VSRTGRQIVSECLDRSCIPLCQDLDAAVVKISDVAANLMFRRRSLGKKAVSHTLYLSAYQKLPSDHISIVASFGSSGKIGNAIHYSPCRKYAEIMIYKA
jgi:hypothetical protein